jgi:hypothetical protein
MTGNVKSTETSGGDKGTALQQSVFGGAPGTQPTQTQGVKRTRDKDESEESESDDAEMDMDESD